MSASGREGFPPIHLPLDSVALTPDAVIDGGAMPPDALLLRLSSALLRHGAGALVEVRTSSLAAQSEIVPWCRVEGHSLEVSADAGDHRRYFIRASRSPFARTADWGARMPRRAGTLDTRDWRIGAAGDLPAEAPTYYGLIPRGTVPAVNTLLPEYPFTLNRRTESWTDRAAELYEQAKAQQWDATRDIPWGDLPALPDDLECAVCQLMTFLAENEYAALLIPSRFLPRINPQFNEVLLFLATVINDEARHIEAFTKRALANGGGLQYSMALTEWSLHGLLVEEDYFRSSFLLHVLGEGTFLELLDFIARYAPDPVTADVVRRAQRDEGRHVAYGIEHVRDVLQAQPVRADELVAAAEQRSVALQSAGASNPIVLEALAILAGGGSRPDQFARGLDRARALYQEMDEARVRRMLQLGLPEPVARKISNLHSPNFM